MYNLSFIGWNSHVYMSNPEGLSQLILVGIILVGRLGIARLACMGQETKHYSQEAEIAHDGPRWPMTG